MTDTYEQRLFNRLPLMQKAWQRWLDGDDLGCQELIIHTHQLSGSAALYGHIELGERANELHLLLQREHPFVDCKTAWLKLQQMIMTINH